MLALARALLIRCFPPAQIGQDRPQERRALVHGPVHVLSHARRAVLDHLFHGGLVGIRALVVAPAAEVFGFGAVRLMSVLVGFGEHHAAALAVVLGHVEQARHGDVELASDELDHVDAGLGRSGLPAADRLARDVEARGEFFLGEAAFASGLGQGVFKQNLGGSPLIGAWAAGFDPAACLRLSRDAP